MHQVDRHSDMTDAAQWSEDGPNGKTEMNRSTLAVIFYAMPKVARSNRSRSERFAD